MSFEAAFVLGLMRLGMLATRSGVYGQLQAISATREFPKEVRLLSALLIGRELPKKWRAKA